RSGVRSRVDPLELRLGDAAELSALAVLGVAEDEHAVPGEVRGVAVPVLAGARVDVAARDDRVDLGAVDAGRDALFERVLVPDDGGAEGVLEEHGGARAGAPHDARGDLVREAPAGDRQRVAV